MNKFSVLSLACLAAGMIAVPAHAVTYANSSDSEIIYFGYPDTTSYGQVFTAPGDSLQSWSFYTKDSSSTGAKLVIANWDGSKAVGPALYDSLSQTTAASGAFTEHTYSSINLALTSGTSYIAFLTVAGVADPTPGVGVSGSNSSPLGGAFYFLNSNGADPLSQNSSWSSWSIPNMQYTAVFGAGAVPEPATWAMMLAGFGAVGYAMRRRRNVAVSFA